MKPVFDALGGRKNTLSLFSIVLITALLVLNKKLDLGLTSADVVAIAMVSIGGVAGLAISDLKKEAKK